MTVIVGCVSGALPQSVGDFPWSETGIPFIRNYGPREYGGDFQNWCIVADNRGVMYAANNLGLLEYDGTTWRLNAWDVIIRSLAVTDSGRIYGSTENDFGYFVPDSLGTMQFHSLKPLLADSAAAFNEVVWYTRCIGNTVFFMANEYLIRAVGNRVTVWRPQVRFNVMLEVNGSLFLSESGRGLTKLEGDSISIVPGGESFAATAAYVMVPIGVDSILIGTYSHGLYLYHGGAASVFITPANAFLERNKLYCGARLQGDLIALGTQRGGLLLMDRHGRIVDIIDKKRGLQDESVWFVEPGPDGGLWLALNNGIARIEMPGPFSGFAPSSGLEGLVERVERYNGSLFVATSLGVYVLAAASGSERRGGEFHSAAFSPVPGIREYTFALLSTADGLLAGTTNGLYLIKGDRVTRVAGVGNTVFSLARSHRPDLVYVVSRDGLGLLKQEGGTWRVAGWLLQGNARILDVVEDPENNVWVDMMPYGLIRFHLPASVDTRSLFGIPVEEFDSARGVPNESLRARSIGGRVLFGGKNSMWRYDGTRNVICIDSTFGPSLSGQQMWGPFATEDRQGRVWTSRQTRPGNESVVVGSVMQDGMYHWNATPFQRLVDVSNIKQIVPEDDGVAWIVADQLFRYDPRVRTTPRKEFPVLIRRVTVNGDSAVWGGNELQSAPVLQYEMHSMRFAFTAPSYDAPEGSMFQVLLEGYDRDWSSWTGETRKDYTGLPEGGYTFRVRGRNVYGETGREASFAFSILPPWYRMWWAYLVYTMLAAGIIGLVVKARIYRLEKRTRELEIVVAERTGQIVMQKNQIEEQAERLREVDRLKSRFFANISHEFRTPLTLILGPLGDLIDQTPSEKGKRMLTTMKSNASRLLHLINQLLDLTRIESGRVKTKASPGNAGEFIRGIVFSFGSLADQRSISLDLSSPEPVPQDAVFDHDMVENILTNLLSNAFKFTQDGGMVAVTVASVPDDPARIALKVSNKGEGIPPEHLPHIFDRFYRVEEGPGRGHQGTGIGLALVRELVELHHGTISVESTPGGLTTFTVVLPVARHLFAHDEVEANGRTREERDARVVIEGETPPPGPTDDNARRRDQDARDLVLIVEDNEDVRQYVRSLLEPTCRVVSAPNGADGLTVALAELPDIVISDVMMPRMDGYELCAAIKANEKTSHIPVLLLTARAAEESRIQGFETGADDYLVKPFQSRELLARVANLIRSRREMMKRFRDEVLVQPADVLVTSANADFLRRAMAVVEDHLSDEEFSVVALSGKLAMTPRQLQRKLNALVNQTPNEFIRSFRLTRSRQMLEQQAGTIAEIAYRVGFGNPSYFAKCFREQFGIAPSEVTH